MSPGPAPGDTTIINATQGVDPSTYEATFVFKEHLPCTATAVGSRVVLTAAHCLAEMTGSATVSEEAVGVECTRHPDYGVISLDTDFALCLLDEPLTRIDFETISTSLAHPRLDESVTLVGYGCAALFGPGDEFGYLRVGKTSVRAPSKADDVTILTEGEAALCFGDSGGAAYFEGSNGRRAIIGVNSRGDIRAKSELAATANLQFLNWALSWSSERGVNICGIHVEATRCRSGP